MFLLPLLLVLLFANGADAHATAKLGEFWGVAPAVAVVQELPLAPVQPVTRFGIRFDQLGAK
jgi:hypothetical protein